MLGVSNEQILSFLCVGVVASLAVGTFFGILSDALGQKKFVVIFFFLHIFVSVLKRVSRGGPLLLASICLSLASSIITFSFEQGLKEELLNDTFWLMTFLGSGCFITTQGLANWLISTDAIESLTSPSSAAICLAVLGLAFVVRGWKRSSQAIGLHNHDMSYTLLFKDKRVVLLTCAQASIQFSGTVFGILWSPTLVADGRELHLGLIYPCLMGARMLGSTIFPWLTSASMSFRTEDCPAYAFMMLLHTTTRKLEYY